MERFGDDGTRDVYNEVDSKGARRTISTTALKVARRKLAQVVAATKVSDLGFPPTNYLEKHKEGGRWSGYHSIQINDQYRVMFRWTDGGAMAIRIADYHND